MLFNYNIFYFHNLNAMRKTMRENTSNLMNWLDENDTVLREAKKIK